MMGTRLDLLKQKKRSLRYHNKGDRMRKRRRKLNQQETFKRVACHLLKQGQTCTNNEGLAQYRNGTLACALGIFIPKRESPPLEGRSCYEDPVAKVLYERISRRSVPLDFLGDLQHIHDNLPPAAWFDALLDFGRAYNLQTGFLTKKGTYAKTV